MVFDPNRPKKVFEIRENVYTYGHPGEYAPRVKRITHPVGPGRPTYRRIRGGEVPRDLPPVLSLPVTLYNLLKRADRVPEA